MRVHIYPARSIEPGGLLSKTCLVALRRIAALARARSESPRGRRSGRRGGARVQITGGSEAGALAAARILARALIADLYRIDLAAVTGKYLGETEARLDRLFAAAARADAVLFFDEAEALLGKRSTIRDGHDRHAAGAVDRLRRRIEDYPGLIIVTVGRRCRLDEAFRKRVDFVIRVPAPARGWARGKS
jgi:SpoVK/Ycf46/Vps4 family AAA+-type ATPase